MVLKDQLHVTGNASFLADGTGSARKLFDLNGGHRQITVADGVTFTNQTVLQNGGFTKTGSGKMIVTAASTYEGGTLVQGGTLEVNSLTGSGTGTGSVQVTNTTLSGIGRVAPSSGSLVTFGLHGVLTPGSSAKAIGNFVIDGDATFLAGNDATDRSRYALKWEAKTTEISIAC